jgi:hypothetical protein
VSKRAVVLGCGPAGLFAAHALACEGWEFDILAKKARKSRLFGAQYLHRPIPGLSASPPVPLSYRLQGTAEGYERKVYGTSAISRIAVKSVTGNYQAWNIREAYDAAWERYGGRVKDIELNYRMMKNFRLFEAFDLVVSSIPAKAICRVPGEHRFLSKKIWAMGDAPFLGQVIDWLDCPPNTVLYNGVDDTDWYRLSEIFGYKTIEYPYDRKPEALPVVEVTKPLSHSCICWPDLVRVGRYGCWDKDALAHQASEDVTNLLA